nr:hypothetical protein [Tanacetum cinerariifolium]
MQELIDCANEVEMENINSTSLFFTWIKSPSKPEKSIMKKLDRMFINEGFMDSYKEDWNKNMDGYTMYIVVQKLKAIKKPMRRLNWKNGDLTERVELCRGKLMNMQKEMVQNHHDKSIKVKEAECLAKYLTTLNAEEKFFFQKPKVD